MAATRSDITEWFRQGVSEGATHMLVVCDTFDYDDYPVFVMSGEDPVAALGEYNRKSMQRVMEVYDLRLDLTRQLETARAWNTQNSPPVPTATIVEDLVRIHEATD